MTLVVQSDSGTVALANGYLSVAEFKQYHTTRGNSWGTATDQNIETAIVRASDFVDQRFTFSGRRLNGRDQTTEWPRLGAFDVSHLRVNGIPKEVKDATAEYALRAITLTLNPDPVRDESGKIVIEQTETVGPLSETKKFQAGPGWSMPRYPAADMKLIRAGLVESGNTCVRA